MAGRKPEWCVITSAKTEKINKVGSSVSGETREVRKDNLTIGRFLMTCERIGAISLKLRKEKSDFIILRKTADDKTEKATGSISCLEKSVTDRKEKVPFLKSGRLMHIFL